MTSGCHCIPYRPRPGASNAATGDPAEVASTRKPAGAACTASPWLIHTDCSTGEPVSSVPGASIPTCVPPYSRVPVRATVPPSACAMAWKP